MYQGIGQNAYVLCKQLLISSNFFLREALKSENFLSNKCVGGGPDIVTLIAELFFGKL